jgi:hypothetical protein
MLVRMHIKIVFVSPCMQFLIMPRRALVELRANRSIAVVVKFVWCRCFRVDLDRGRRCRSQRRRTFCECPGY